MSKTKPKSKSKKKKSGSSNVKATEPTEVPVDIDAEEELSAGEKFLMASKPYWAHILLGVLCVIFASVLYTAWGNMSTENASLPWRDLNTAITQAGLSSDVASLKDMAEKNPGVAASHWALLMAGDDEMNRGIGMLARDRVGGRKLIERSIESIQKVVDAPASSKTPMVQRRSVFMLATANEAIGKFEIAKTLYQSLIDDAPDSPFTEACERGVDRCSDPELVAFYDKFREWEEAAEEAPGPLVPDAPKLNIDEIKLPEGEPETFGGGDFGGDDMQEEDADAEQGSESAEEATAEEESKAVEEGEEGEEVVGTEADADASDASDEKPATEKAADESSESADESSESEAESSGGEDE